jgi:hypothetical protein
MFNQNIRELWTKCNCFKENIYVLNHKLHSTAEIWLNNMILVIIFSQSFILYFELADTTQIRVQLMEVES